jgi:hypothetical protein
MKDKPLSKRNKDTKRKKFDPEPLTNRIEALMGEKNWRSRRIKPNLQSNFYADIAERYVNHPGFLSGSVDRFDQPYGHCFGAKMI